MNLYRVTNGTASEIVIEDELLSLVKEHAELDLPTNSLTTLTFQIILSPDELTRSEREQLLSLACLPGDGPKLYMTWVNDHRTTTQHC